ncbi:hypothetical protein [Pseudomonas sp. Pseu.R1]|uniref:hypothetical protein n=1 Tax=Pseudomonas sp. Pseu.R1 TaxID=3379818 RepID=UPI003B952D71
MSPSSTPRADRVQGLLIALIGVVLLAVAGYLDSERHGFLSHAQKHHGGQYHASGRCARPFGDAASIAAIDQGHAGHGGRQRRFTGRGGGAIYLVGLF